MEPSVNPVDHLYADLIDRILTNGDVVRTRNSVCRRVFGERITLNNQINLALVS